jgi:anthranilate phosphoribosyltransferase
MKLILQKIIERNDLSYEESKAIIYALLESEINEFQLTGVLIGLQLKGLHLNEITGFRDALLELAIPLDLDASRAIDLCGTGGDGKNTFNISTTASFVLAAMGHQVIKHGNYGVSSICGSSNVLESLGVQFSCDEKELNQSLAKQNICFLHAPLFHPVLKKVAPIRKSLGIRTVFNALGPLVNPVQPKFQVTGTYSMELATIYQHLLKEKREVFKVVYGVNGFDELTFTDKSRILGNDCDLYLTAKDVGLDNPLAIEDLGGGKSIEEAKKILLAILQGKGTVSQNQVVAGNVALGLQCYHPTDSFQNLYNEAKKVIQSGIVAKHFQFN